MKFIFLEKIVVTLFLLTVLAIVAVNLIGWKATVIISNVEKVCSDNYCSVKLYVSNDALSFVLPEGVAASTGDLIVISGKCKLFSGCELTPEAIFPVTNIEEKP